MDTKTNKAVWAVTILCFAYIAGMMLICKIFQGMFIGFFVWVIYTLAVVLGAVIYDKMDDQKEANHRLAKELNIAQMQLIRERGELLAEIDRLRRELEKERGK